MIMGLYDMFLNKTFLLKGSGGGASGRVVAFCLSGLGLKPGRDLAFLVQNCCLSILTGRQAFSKNM